jgi:hypothetical protein
MKKKKKEYQKPKITSEKVFEENALQCTVTGRDQFMQTPMGGCDCTWKVTPGGNRAVRS